MSFRDSVPILAAYYFKKGCEKMSELWTKELLPPRFPPLHGDTETDILVIGGGMAGILCARRLQELGARYLLVEGGRIGRGITKGTTAVISAQHGAMYYDLAKRRGMERARQYLQANLDAVERFRGISREIPCDFEDAPSIVYSMTDRKRMEREAETVRELGFRARFLDEVPLPHGVAGAVEFPRMAQFHPLKFLYGIARSLNIREKTFVQKIHGHTAVTNRGSIRARRIIIATHFPFINRHGFYYMKLYQRRSFVIALENAPNIGCTLEDDAAGGIYLRNWGDLLLVGGGDHRTGKKGGGFAVPRAFAKKYYPGAREVCAWANQDCMSLDEVPYIGRYSLGFPHVFTATGFNAWGMTTSMVAADLLADLVLGRKNELKALYTPTRSMLTGQLFANLGETFVDYLIPTTRRCPHLGCALRWNSAEHSWDCPCHGSRFEENGKRIDNPAMHDL